MLCALETCSDIGPTVCERYGSLPIIIKVGAHQTMTLGNSNMDKPLFHCTIEVCERLTPPSRTLPTQSLHWDRWGALGVTSSSFLLSIVPSGSLRESCSSPSPDPTDQVTVRLSGAGSRDRRVNDPSCRIKQGFTKRLLSDADWFICNSEWTCCRIFEQHQQRAALYCHKPDSWFLAEIWICCPWIHD